VKKDREFCTIYRILKSKAKKPRQGVHKEDAHDVSDKKKHGGNKVSRGSLRRGRSFALKDSSGLGSQGTKKLQKNERKGLWAKRKKNSSGN